MLTAHDPDPDQMKARTTPTAMVAVSLKMYFSHARTRQYCQALAAMAGQDAGLQTGRAELLVLPSFPALPAALDIVAGTRVRVGAQDLAEHDTGAYTGEVSGAELAELGVTHVEVGHAERRRLFHETDAVVAAKTRAAFRNHLVPLLCVGEHDRSTPATAADLCLRQILSATATDETQPGPMIIAYEPVWAIGAPHPAPSGYVADVCDQLRGALADHPRPFRILYGGSAGPGLLTSLGDSVDGLFLGRFAHDPAAVADVLAEAANR